MLEESLRDELFIRALRLSETERVRLAREILQSVEQFELTDEQRGELREAMAAIDLGEYVDGEVFFRELGSSG